LSIPNTYSGIRIFERSIELAELGRPGWAYQAAAFINASDNYPNRRLESLKWLLIAQLFDPETVPEKVIDFMYYGSTQDEVDKVSQMVEQWFIDKNRNAQNTDESQWHENILKGKYPQRYPSGE